MIRFDFDLTEYEQAQLQAIKPEAWFTQFAFRNAISPRQPPSVFSGDQP